MLTPALIPRWPRPAAPVVLLAVVLQGHAVAAVLEGLHVGPVLERLPEVADVALDVGMALDGVGDNGLDVGAGWGGGLVSLSLRTRRHGHAPDKEKLTMKQKVNHGCSLMTRALWLPQL